jgi:predicted thioesterase
MGIDPEVQPLERFVTASIKVDYLAPTPVNTTIELRARVREINGRKVWLDVIVSADDKIRAKGQALMIQIPDGK